MDTIYTIYTILQYNCIILIYRKHRTKVHFLHFTVYRQHIQMCGKRVINPFFFIQKGPCF